jgi:hypothetical protein
MKRARSINELRQQLQEQLHLLQGYCTQFDAGDWLAAKPMSTTLRVLLHHPDKPRPGQGSLLAQLGLRGGFWFDSTRIVGMNTKAPKGGEMSWPQILMMQIGQEGTGFKPKLLAREINIRRSSFMEWWSSSLATHPKYGAISRKKIVAGMADQDGGAHVDGNIDIGYDAFSNGAYFNITIGDNKELARGATHACIRTIAHECFLTINRYEPRAIVTPYKWSALGGAEIYSIPCPTYPQSAEL